MDHLLNYVVQYRGIEKILIILGAILCIVLGYKLFRHGINDIQTAEWESSNFSLKLSRVSPGTFFAVLGASVLLWSTYNNTQVTLTNLPVVTEPSKPDPTISLQAQTIAKNPNVTSSIDIIMNGGSKPSQLFRAYNTTIDLVSNYDWKDLTSTEQKAIVSAILFIKGHRDHIVRERFGQVNYDIYLKYRDDYFTGKNIPKQHLSIVKEINEALSENFIQ